VVQARPEAAAALSAPRQELADSQRRDRGQLLSGADRLTLPHGVDRVEVYRERGVQLTFSGARTDMPKEAVHLVLFLVFIMP
jgi:hypothetical protein